MSTTIEDLHTPAADTGSAPDTNPFLDPLRFERRVPECTAVIFGANGDLTKRKLLPALYSLARDRRLSAGFAVANQTVEKCGRILELFTGESLGTEPLNTEPLSREAA